MTWRKSDRIAREAAEWVVLIDSAAFDASSAARFRRWLEQSEDCRAAFLLANRAWTDLDQLERLKAYPEITAILNAPAKDVSHEARRATPNRRALIFGAGSTALVAGAASYALLSPGPAQAYETGVGERRDVALADGTRIVLNARTRIEARIGADARRVRLVTGEALFSVAESASGPLLIAIPSGEIEAVSGDILVKELPDGVRVALLSEGARASRRGLFGDRASIAVAPQNEILFGPELVEVDARPSEALLRRTLWREGRLAFDDTPLAEAVADVSRQTGARFEFADSALGELRVGGLIEARDLDAFLLMLRQNLAVSAHRRADGVIELAS